MEITKVIAVICGLIGTCIAAYKFFWKAPSEKETIQVKDIPETIATRLIALFESHGVHRNQIPEFFDHGLDIPACASDEKLLEKITPEIIHDAVVLFGVNKDWLEGSSKVIYDIPDFYKQPEKFEKYLIELLKNTFYKEQIYAYALTTETESSGAYHDALIVITEPIGELNQREIYKYHLLGRWKIEYWKSRAYFAACCALLYKNQINAGGKVVKQEWLNKVYEGRQLLEYDFNEGNGGVTFPLRGSWIVDEFIEMPAKYLRGMDTEQGSAVDLALNKWLSLSEKGYMRCWAEDEAFHDDVKASFRKKIKESI
jgi:hypothetical protein